jgi:hypothetical protein
MSTDILLSLRSLSSFFCFSLSVRRPSSFALRESLFSLSECKLRRELEPLRSDGKPNTDDFFCGVVLGKVGEISWGSLTGDEALGGRKWWFAEYVGDVDGMLGGGICINCEDERRKNGIEDGVRRLVDGPLRMEDDGLSGICEGMGGIDAVRFVLELDAVSGRLGTRRSGVFEAEIGGGADAGGEAGVTEPTEDIDTSEDADPIASTLMLVHSSADCLRAVDGDLGCSLEVDLRSCCVKLKVRGLSAMPDFESFIED